MPVVVSRKRDDATPGAISFAVADRFDVRYRGRSDRCAPSGTTPRCSAILAQQLPGARNVLLVLLRVPADVSMWPSSGRRCRRRPARDGVRRSSSSLASTPARAPSPPASLGLGRRVYDEQVRAVTQSRTHGRQPLSVASIVGVALAGRSSDPDMSVEFFVERGLQPEPVVVDHSAPTTARARGAGSPCASCHEITGLRSTPIRSISASITSPGLR